MAQLPADRTKLAQAQSNMAPSFTASSQKLKDALTEAYDTVDLLNQKADNHAAAVTLPHADKSVTRAKLADKVVGAGQLDDAAVGQSHHQDNGIPSRALPDNVILQRHMSDNSVGSAEIIAGAVQRTHIQNGVVGSGQLDPSLLQNYGDIAVNAEFDERGINVLKFGAIGDGVTNETAAFKSALDYVIANGKTKIRIPSGTYLIDEWVINSSNISISALGMVTIKARSNNKTLLKISASSCVAEDITLDNNGKTGCTGLGLIPEDESQTTKVVDQSYNKIRNVTISGFDNGVVMRCGPTVGGVTSGCYYNTLDSIRFVSNKRDLWLRESTGTGGSPVNRNRFFSIRFGQVSNTGLQIDSGDTNSFIACSFEGVESGTTPNGVATAIKISNTDAYGNAIQYNTFISCFFEANTRDLENYSISTSMIGCNVAMSKMIGTLPKVLIPFDTSATPFIIPGAKLYDNVGSTIPSNVFNFDSPPVDTGFKWTTYALTTTNMTNVSSVYKAWSEYTQLSKMVDWQFRVIFQATAAGAVIDINLPVNPENNLYLDVNFMETMHFPAVVASVVTGNYVYLNVVCYFIAGNKLRIVLPPAGSAWTAWNTGGAFNMIHVMLRYRAA